MKALTRAATISVAATIALAGCAQAPKEISATYVSPLLYQNLSCEQLAQEGHRVSARAAVVTGTQQEKASNDAVMMGVGLVLFWPALFFIKGDKETAAEVGRLKGEMEAIEQASIANNCGITFNPGPPAQPSATPPAM